MAVMEISCNLSSSIFAFSTELWGRSIIFPQLDENYNKTIFSTADPGFEKGVPQVYYMHNCMPTVQGYQAIGYDLVVSPFFHTDAPVVTLFDKTFPIQTAKQNDFLFVPAGGRNFIYSGATDNWRSISPFPPGAVPSNVQVSTAFIHGETYIFYANYGCFIFDEVASVLTPVTLAGLDVTQILAIAEANGYMIAVSVDAVAWSSLIDATDFVPSLITGAGGGSVNDAKGPVVAALSITGGFVIYCKGNAVGATYTGNSTFPFIFLEVAGSGGINTVEQIAYSTNMPVHTMLGSYGIQELNKTLAKAIYTEASDFLSSKIYEDFDDATNAISAHFTEQQLSVKIVTIQARYLVISYGQLDLVYTYAIVYDLTLKRWGKLKITHTDCFEWNTPNRFTVTEGGGTFSITHPKVLPKKSIAFLQGDGTVFLVNFDYSESKAAGVFIIGKFQYRRRNWIMHQYGTVETVNRDDDFQYFILPTIDGKNIPSFSQVEGRLNLELSGPKSRVYQKQVAGMNVSILFKGKFNLTTQLFAFTVMGNR